MAKTKFVTLYDVELLNEEKVLVKNTGGEKVKRLKEKIYIRDYKFNSSIPRVQLKDYKIDYDLDRVRSYKEMHRMLVIDPYMNI